MKDVEKNVVYAACPYCGQQVIVDGETKDLEEYAKLHCKCSPAIQYQNRINRTEALTEVIEWRCKEVPSIKTILLNAVPILLEGGVKSIVLKGKDDKTYQISEKDNYLKFKDKELTEFESDEI